MNRLCQKKLILMLVVICLFGTSLQGVRAEEAALYMRLEEIAAEQAEKMNDLMDSESYLYLFVPALDRCDAEERQAMISTDYSDPRKVNIVVRPEEELELVKWIEMPDEERKILTECARTELCIMPIRLIRDYQAVEWRTVQEELALNDAIELLELNGAAYIIQLYDAQDHVQPPMLVTAVVTTEYPAALVHTEIVCAKDGDIAAMVGHMLYLLNVYTGEFATEDVVMREYRQMEVPEATDEPKSPVSGALISGN